LSCSPGISPDSTNVPGTLFISELLEVRAGGCGGLAPRPPGKIGVCFEFILIFSEISRFQYFSGWPAITSVTTQNLPGPLLTSELLEVRAAPSVADLELLQSALNLQGPLLRSELLEVRAGGCGGLAPRPPRKINISPCPSDSDSKKKFPQRNSQTAEFHDCGQNLLFFRGFVKGF